MCHQYFIFFFKVSFVDLSLWLCGVLPSRVPFFSVTSLYCHCMNTHTWYDVKRAAYICIYLSASFSLRDVVVENCGKYGIVIAVRNFSLFWTILFLVLNDF